MSSWALQSPLLVDELRGYKPFLLRVNKCWLRGCKSWCKSPEFRCWIDEHTSDCHFRRENIKWDIWQNGAMNSQGDIVLQQNKFASRKPRYIHISAKSAACFTTYAYWIYLDHFRSQSKGHLDYFGFRSGAYPLQHASLIADVHGAKKKQVFWQVPSVKDRSHRSRFQKTIYFQ